nr:MAG TPA: integrating conjugative element protein [Caudoviricetes sp.]
MNEITLSNNLSQIELEISHHKQIAGQSIWEIGRRLNHVKENDLVHGQFREWHESLGLDKDFAYKSMKIAKELPNVETLRHLGTTALHLIATLPEEEKQEQIQRIEDGDTPTVRELKEVKNKLKLSQQANELLRDENETLKASKVEVREIIKEVVPDDYGATRELNKRLLVKNQELSDSMQAMKERSDFITNKLNEMMAQRAEADKKSAQYDELTRAIEESRGQLNNVQKQISVYKNITSLLQKGNDFLASMGGLIYADEKNVLKADGVVRDEFDSFISRGLRFFNDLNDIRKENNILEGEFE